MSATTAGPASGTAELILGGVQYLEVQVPAGLPSLSPCFAPYVDPQNSYAGTIINKAVAGTSITIANPA